MDLSGVETAHCAYTSEPTDKSSTLKTATVVLNSINFNATAEVDWSDDAANINEIDECVGVEDTEGGFLGTVCADQAPQRFNYRRSFGPFTVAQCGELDFPNTASFETNDITAATGSGDHNVHVTIPCPTGCTLTLGYWKTHNDSFAGGAPTDDTWEEIGPLAEEEIFFSGQTYFDVFWTDPLGNAYYNLAHQYIAAVLNRLSGADDLGGIDDAITQAEALFNTTCQSKWAHGRGIGASASCSSSWRRFWENTMIAFPVSPTEMMMDTRRHSDRIQHPFACTWQCGPAPECRHECALARFDRPGTDWGLMGE